MQTYEVLLILLNRKKIEEVSEDAQMQNMSNENATQVEKINPQFDE